MLVKKVQCLYNETCHYFNGRFFYEKEKVELNPASGASTLEKRLLTKASSQNVPINGSFELLPLCNMHCNMCYVHMSQGEMKRKGQLHTAEEWIRIGEHLTKAGTLFLLLTGGEPLLFPDFKKLYLALKKMGMILSINTNGTLLDESWADFFAENKPRRINITLYGASRETYRKLCHFPDGYDRTMKALKLLKERDVDVRIGVSVAPENVEDIPDIAEIANKLEMPLNIDTYMMPAVREQSRTFDERSRLTPERAAELQYQCYLHEMDMEKMDTFVREILRRSENINTDSEKAVPGRMTCLAGTCSYTINWQGHMRPCVIQTEPEVSVFEEGVERAWQIVSERCHQIRSYSGCSICPNYPVCHVCPACCLLEGGSYERRPVYMCRYSSKLMSLLEEYAKNHKEHE